jgi:glyceraldehyde-3-phosphate dehydrogenase (NAD(P))
MSKKIVHVVGTGTIGEPLIGMFAHLKEAFGLDEVTFHKRTPLKAERAKVESLVRRGGRLAVDADVRGEFEKLGHKPQLDAREAIERASVVIDCTPAGNENKERIYSKVSGPLGFIAQGSEFGFGKMYARGINDEALKRGPGSDGDRFIHVVSCNTHNISVLVKTIAGTPDGKLALDQGRFVCMRRASDISQDNEFIPSPKVGKHDDARFGTHHARDAFHLFQTLGLAPNLYSSSVKLNTQYMHTLWFNLILSQPTSREQVIAKLKENTRVAMTERTSATTIFSFGRDHGFFGRILSQTVLPHATLSVRDDREVVGFCFTPQDGNALLSSIAATLWWLYPEGFEQRIDAIRPYLFREV